MTSIYIESGDEITTVIERLRGASDKQVALVAPKGATLLQSVVNLKLARKAANDAGKSIVIVTTDKIGRNLCEQLGIAAGNTEEDAASILSGASAPAANSDAKVIGGVRVHNYYDEEHSGSESQEADTKIEPIIIPKQLLKEEVVAAEAAIEVPAGTPEPPAPAEVVVPAAAVPLAEASPLTRSTVARPEEAMVETIAPHDKKAVKAAPAPLSKNHKRALRLSLFLGGVALLIIASVAFLFFPIMRVELKVSAIDWTRELAFSASSDLTSPSSDNTALPAEILSVTSEKTVGFKATGSKQVGEKATGTVTFYNYSTTSSVTVPSGTTVSSSGKTFVTTEAIVVPGYTQSPGQPPSPGSKSGAIVANEGGPDSNLSNTSASNVTINGAVLSFNSVNTTGGTSRTVTVVSADDINKAKAELGTELAADAAQKLADQLTNRDVSYKADADVSEPGAVSQTVAAGDEVENGEVKGTLVLRRTVVNKPTLDGAIADRLRAEQLTNRTYEVTSKDIVVSTVSSDGKLVSLTANITGKEAPVVPSEELAKKLIGKSFSAGEKILTDAVPNATVSSEQRPGWWPVRRYPTLGRYILVHVVYD